MDITTLKNKYFVQAADASPPSEPIPKIYGNCNIIPLIGSKEYYGALSLILDRVGTSSTPADNSEDFFYISLWLFDLLGMQIEQAGDVLGLMGPIAIPSSWGRFSLDPPTSPGIGGILTPGSKVLLEILKEKARLGVDVRILGFISTALLESSIAQRTGGGFSKLQIITQTMVSLNDLRTEPFLENKVLLNILGHTIGSIHSKVVVVGNTNEHHGWGIGFTGGYDFSNSRHEDITLWHDIQAQIEGPGVQALYDYFCMLWNENIERPTRTYKINGTTMPTKTELSDFIVPHDLILIDFPNNHHIQSLRTIPQFNYVSHNILPENIPLIDHPQGCFEIRTAWRKAILAATKYIYMEDQCFWSAEIMSWINEAIKADTEGNLYVILVAKGAKDPTDPTFPEQGYLSESINRSLLSDLSNSQIKRIRLFKRYLMNELIHFEVKKVTKQNGTSLVETDAVYPYEIPENQLKEIGCFMRSSTGNDFYIFSHENIPAGNPISFIVNNLSSGDIPIENRIAILIRPIGITVHSKTTLIDDHWAMIGSANCNIRSLYTDFEHSISFVDEADEIVKEYRKKLWGIVLGIAPGDLDHLDNINRALNIWEPTWGTGGSGLTRSSGLIPIPLPLNPEITLNSSEQQRYDNIVDFDSRNEWGGIIP